jgi:hypothetical protein
MCSPLDDRRAIVRAGRGPPAGAAGRRQISGSGLGGSLGLVSAALDPAADGKDLFSVTRVPLAALTDELLAGARVVVLGDLPALDAAGVAALEHFVVAGGGVLVGLGPDTNPELVNRFWSRGGDGFLPCNLLASVQPPVPGGPRHRRLQPSRRSAPSPPRPPMPGRAPRCGATSTSTWVGTRPAGPGACHQPRERRSPDHRASRAASGASRWWRPASTRAGATCRCARPSCR